MTSVLLLDMGLRSTASSGLSIPPRLASIAISLSAVFGLYSMPATNDVEPTQKISFGKFSYEGIESPLSSFIVTDEKKALSSETFNLESIDADINDFMASLDSDVAGFYSDELIAFAEKIIEENPQAFKSFL